MSFRIKQIISCLIFSTSFSIIILLITGNSNLCFGQEEKPLPDEIAYIGFYPELAGNGGLLSINIETGIYFKERKGGIYLRMGKGDDYSGIGPVLESGYFMGNGKHYFDSGIGYSDADQSKYYFTRIGYRYHGKKGLILRLAPMLVYKIERNPGMPTEKTFGGTGGLALGYRIPIVK
jgi:hypothetical protein